jgi:hypothetical protein
MLTWSYLCFIIFQIPVCCFCISCFVFEDASPKGQDAAVSIWWWQHQPIGQLWWNWNRQSHLRQAFQFLGEAVKKVKGGDRHMTIYNLHSSKILFHSLLLKIHGCCAMQCISPLEGSTWWVWIMTSPSKYQEWRDVPKAKSTDHRLQRRTQLRNKCWRRDTSNKFDVWCHDLYPSRCCPHMGW